MGKGDSGDAGKPSDFDASLPDNAAEAQAAKDAAKERGIDRVFSDSKAKEKADSFWSSVFGGKKDR